MPKHLQTVLDLVTAQATDKGVEKPENEDCMGLRIPSGDLLTMKGVTAIVSDGVSTAEAGKEASQACVNNFLNDYYSTPDSWTVTTAGQKVLTALNRWLYNRADTHMQDHKGYVSTLSILIIKSNTAHIFHVGDSRIYRLREGALEQLTTDHSAALRGEQVHLTRAMGMDIKLGIDYKKTDVLAGDLFFLSTDGVHDFIDSRSLKQQLRDVSNHQKCCEALIAKAKEAGSKDNLTCQIIHVLSLPEAEAEEVCRQLSELAFPPDLEMGMKLDDYRVEALIHASNRSQLYRVKDEVSGETYVMKTPSVNYEDDMAYIERFIMEPWVGQRLNSKHIVKVIEKRKKPQFLYYLTEYVDGLTLTQWMQENPDPALKDVVKIVEQIVKGVQSFHKNEVIHQDIKPDNIMLSHEGVVKLLDFGSCYVAGVHEIAAPIVRDMVLGTADFSAPEVVLEGHISVLADQFSLGCIVYKMLTGKLPYGEGIETIRDFDDLSKLEYTPAYHLNSRVPVWMDGAIHRAVKRRAIKRYETLPDFLYDLKNPNWEYLKEQRKPLIKKDPVKFWKRVFIVMAVIQTFLLFLVIIKSID